MIVTTPLKDASAPIHDPLGKQKVKVLQPQDSRTFALRRNSDSSSSDVRALNTLDRYRTHPVTPASLLRIEAHFQDPPDISPLEKEPTGQQLVKEDEETEVFSTPPPARPASTKSYKTGQFLFADEHLDDTKQMRAGPISEIPDSSSRGSIETIPTALGTMVMAGSSTAAPPRCTLPSNPDFRSSLEDMSVVPQPAHSPAPIFINDPLGRHLDNLSTTNLAPTSNLPSLNQVAQGNNCNQKRRRRAIQKIRRVVLRKRLLSVLIGRDAAVIVMSSVKPTKDLTRSGNIPNLDGTMGILPASLMETVRIVSSLESSPISSGPSSRMLSRRPSQIGRWCPENTARRSRHNSKLRMPRILAPMLHDPLHARMSLQEGVRQHHVGTTKRPSVISPPRTVLAAEVQSHNQRKSWKHRFRARIPKKGLFGTLFQSHPSALTPSTSSPPVVKARGWRFWKISFKSKKPGKAGAKAESNQ